MGILPSRRTLRTRWTTLAWAGGICVMAASFVGRGEAPTIETANVSATNAAQASALLAEDE